MRLVTFFYATIFSLVVTAAGCVHGGHDDFQSRINKTLKNKFSTKMIYETKKPLSGAKFATLIWAGRSKQGHNLEYLESEVRKILSQKGLKYVANTVDANFVIFVDYSESKAAYEGMDLYSGLYRITGLHQQYGKRAQMYFRSSASFWISHKPSPAETKVALNNIINNIKTADYSVSSKTSKGQPGCAPRFGFFAKYNEDGQARVVEIVKGLPFAKAGIRVGDILLSVNAKPYPKGEMREWNRLVGNKNVGHFVFLRDGKSFEKEIKTKMHCDSYTPDKAS